MVKISDLCKNQNCHCKEWTNHTNQNSPDTRQESPTRHLPGIQIVYQPESQNQLPQQIGVRVLGPLLGFHVSILTPGN